MSETTKLVTAARLPQYFAVFSASLGALAAGNVLGYTSPASFQFRKLHARSSSPESEHDSSYYHYDIHNASLLSYNVIAFLREGSNGSQLTLTDLQVAWFSASSCIGALLGGVTSSPLQRVLGRRGAMLASVLPCLTGWLLLGFGGAFPLLVVGRILTGLFTGINSVVVNTYIGELASSDIRGKLACSFELMFSTGIMMAHGLGEVADWNTIALICCLPPALMALLMAFSKESPVYLLIHGRENEARAVLQYFRGSHYDISSEFQATQRAVEEAAANKMSLAVLKQGYIYKPLLIVLALMVLKQLSGINGISSNLAAIFKEAGSPLSVHTSSVVVVSTQVLAAVISMQFVDSLGRKKLLIGSGVSMALGHGLLGLYFLLAKKDALWTTQYLSWLPFFALILYMFIFAVGIGSICWILIGEMFPPNVRETAGALAIVVDWITSFIVIFSYDRVQVATNTYGLYWMFASCCLLGSLFAAVFLKETEGKTLEQITAMYGGSDNSGIGETMSSAKK